MSVELPLLVGIAGPSCSGKSTLEQNLQLRFGDQVSTFPFDDMFIGEEIARSMDITDWENPNLYRWDEYTSYLKTLKSGEPVNIDARSPKSRDERITHRTIKPAAVIIVAGFLALHDAETSRLFDTTLYIDIPDDEIVRRRLRRAKPDDPWDSEGYILGGLLNGTRKHVTPQRLRAAHIIDGMQSPEQLTANVANIILSRITFGQ
jgi:uridine kinase